MAKLKASTLIETLVAMSILAFILAAAIYLFSNVLSSNQHLTSMRAEKNLDLLIREFKLEDDAEFYLIEDGLTYKIRSQAYQQSDVLWLKATVHKGSQVIVEKNKLLLSQ